MAVKTLTLLVALALLDAVIGRGVTDMGPADTWDSHYEALHAELLAQDAMANGGVCQLAAVHRAADRPDVWGCGKMSQYKCARAADYCEFVETSEIEDEEPATRHIADQL